MRNYRNFLTALTFFFSLSAMANYSKQQYTEKWSGTAILEMVNHKIPASITIAQGILESACGNSSLAVNGNNHFGIKCHEWTGSKMYVDDDAKGECFRVYAKAEESFADHSAFLTGRSRYAKLFTYEILDYKSWAKGLKEAGYATNPKYPDLLIGIIEDMKLYELDLMGAPNNIIPPVLVSNEQKTDDSKTVSIQENKENEKKIDTKSNNSNKGKGKIIDLEGKNSKMISNTHDVAVHTNDVKYIIAKKGDTYVRIAAEFDMALWQLYKYNDFDENKEVLNPGDIVYLQPKRNKARDRVESIKLEKSMTLIEISQMHAIKLTSLQSMNEIGNPNEIIKKGTKIRLK